MKAYHGLRLLTGLLLALVLTACTTEKSPLDTQSDKPRTNAESPDTILLPIQAGTRARAAITGQRNSTRVNSNRSAFTSGTHVYGTVKQPNGKPLSGAQVQLVGVGTSHASIRDVASTTTLADGSYRITTDETRIFYLRFKGEFPEVLVPLFDRDSAVDRSQPILKDVTVPASHLLQGVVLNENNQPVEGAPVHLRFLSSRDSRAMVSSQSTTSTADGSFSFPHAVAGDLVCGAKAEGYAPVSTKVTLPTSNTVTLRLGSRGGTIRGEVVRTDNSMRVPNFRMQLMPVSMGQIPDLNYQTTLTDATGTFQFDHVSSASHRLMPIPGSKPQMGLAPPDPGAIVVGEGETTDVLVSVYPGYTISGKVYDEATSQPLAGVKISDYTGSIQTTSDANGQYNLSHVLSHSDKNVTIVASDDDYVLVPQKPEWESIGALQAPDVSVFRSLTIPVVEGTFNIKQDISMQRKLTVTGVVVTEDEVPVSAGTARFESGFGDFQTEVAPLHENGTFKVRVAPAVSGHIRIKAVGFAPGESDPLNLKRSDVEGLKILLRTACTIQGMVLLPDGKPASGAEIIHRSTKGDAMGQMVSMRPVGKTDANGQFSITGLPRNIEVAARLKPYADSEYDSFMLNPGEIKTGLVLQLQSVKGISGRVIDSSGVPQPSISINAERNSTGAHAETDSAGRFTLSGLQEGVYDVEARGPLGHKSITGVASGTTNLEIILDKRETFTLIGTVIDQISRQPIDDFIIDETEVQRLEGGKFRLEGIRKDVPKVLRISSPRHHKHSFNVERPKSGNQFEKTFELGTEGVVSGRVIDAATASPVPGVTVTCWGSPDSGRVGAAESRGTAQTDADGRFVLGPIPSSTNQFHFKGTAEHIETVERVDVISEKNTDMGDIELRKAGGIQGKVVRGSGEKPVPGITVFCGTQANGIPVLHQQVTDAEGRFRFDGLSTNFCSLRVENVYQQVQTKSDQTVDVVLRLGATTMRGQVTRGGTGVSATLTVKGDKQYYRQSSTEGGLYVIPGIVSGQYNVSIHSGDSSSTEQINIPDQTEFQRNFTIP